MIEDPTVTAITTNYDRAAMRRDQCRMRYDGVLADARKQIELFHSTGPTGFSLPRLQPGIMDVIKGELFDQARELAMAEIEVIRVDLSSTRDVDWLLDEPVWGETPPQ